MVEVVPIEINQRDRGEHVLKRMQHEKEERKNETSTVLEFLESYTCGVDNTISW